MNASSSASNIESPKTPGGISKSYLTPCRRVGLSRKWKQTGKSPFISPYRGSSLTPKSDLEEEKTESRKRKECDSDNEYNKTPEATSKDGSDIVDTKKTINDSTPIKNVALPQRKKSKTLLSAINKTEDYICQLSPVKTILEHDIDLNEINKIAANDDIEVSIPVRTKSKANLQNSSKENIKDTQNSQEDINDTKKIRNLKDLDEIEDVFETKQNPNELKKVCMVVIQKKIFKKEISNNQKPKNSNGDETMFDSDISLKKLTPESKRLSQKRNSESKLKTNTKEIVEKHSPKSNRSNKTINQIVLESQFDDDDDFEPKKTIIIRKTYPKLSKPIKAKSIGSITQRDIDELKARIETKKKLILSKAITEDNKELRDLIKKWQKGCQDALMELMDLMKKKLPDISHMDYSEILKNLNIPASLVGYDIEDDCFNTPDDASIILANFNDL